MKRRALLVTAVAGVAVLIGLACFFLWLQYATDPMLELKIVRRHEENAKSVVFFRLQSRNRARIQITEVEKITRMQQTWQSQSGLTLVPSLKPGGTRLAMQTPGFW